MDQTQQIIKRIHTDLDDLISIISTQNSDIDALMIDNERLRNAVPKPPRSVIGADTKYAAMAKLEVSESIFLPGVTINQASSAACYLKKRYNPHLRFGNNVQTLNGIHGIRCIRIA